MKKKIGIGIVCVAAALLLVLGIFCYPHWKAAKLLKEHFNPERVGYTLEVQLLEEQMTDDQKQFVDVLSMLTGINTENFYKLHLEGTTWDGIVEVQVFPDGQENPLFELYLSDESEVMNGAMFYQTVRANLSGGNALIERLLPKWEDHTYVTLEQAEQIFGIDLSAVRNFSLPQIKEPSTSSWFMALLAMKRENGDNEVTYAAEKAGAAVKLVLPEEGNVTVEFDVPNLQETLTAINEKASLSIDTEQFVLVGQLSGTVSAAGQEELSVPEDCISQDTVEILEGVRVLIQELLAK
uniref:hypothetical protein n=1 Tax=Roseburia sp. TaxID=2049040 RepID=UPI003FED5C3F